MYSRPSQLFINKILYIRLLSVVSYKSLSREIKAQAGEALISLKFSFFF